ncbi:MAG: ATP-dependent DNA helicase RecG [Candidatus Moranbacteria bacterium]|nr:ATP-dependent DNA helicase RecG [Candidatus Moranbacteria bacterium]
MPFSDTLLKNIPKITPKYLKILEKLGLFTVQDFLFYLPFRYDDFSQTVALSNEYLNSVVTISAVVTKTKLNRIFRRRMTIAEVYLKDENQTALKAAWFNQPFILESMPIGTQVRLSGKLELKGKYFTLTNPAWERASREKTNTGQLVPVYSETPGITSKWIRWQMKTFLEKNSHLEDYVPEDLRKKLHLYSLISALRQIHFPENQEKLLIAQKTFAFREMFLMQLKTLQMKNIWEAQSAISLPFDESLIKNFTEKLPFKLTGAQKKASFEILKDLEKSAPMNRLLNGDVGAGKTVVAAISALSALSQNQQVAILAPTEVLALQHFQSFSKLFENYDFNIALLTSSYKLINSCHSERSIFEERKNTQSKNLPTVIHMLSDKSLTSRLSTADPCLPAGRLRTTSPAGGFAQDDKKKITRISLLESIKSGGVSLIIGTHAIIQKDVAFRNLALVVIDEQHRFGVAQRSVLQQETMELKDGEKKTIPHLLTMTATPIPRTLAIAFFGSLDLSILDEMPKNRKPIKTRIVLPAQRDQVYAFMRREIDADRQVFVILPFVEESKVLTEVKAAAEEHKKLSLVFPEYSLGLLHGRLKSKEKETVMQDFKDRKNQILVSTSVVEVGIDIPNATIMLIENSDRFGLSQLHQFRGRVGRGEHQSYCFLFTDSTTQTSLERLRALEKSNDGFALSEIDLKLRGPGQLLGKAQSGLSDIAMENLNNLKLIKIARAEAQNILKTDSKLKKHPLLAKALEKFAKDVHLE